MQSQGQQESSQSPTASQIQNLSGAVFSGNQNNVSANFSNNSQDKIYNQPIIINIEFKDCQFQTTSQGQGQVINVNIGGLQQSSNPASSQSSQNIGSQQNLVNSYQQTAAPVQSNMNVQSNDHQAQSQLQSPSSQILQKENSQLHSQILIKPPFLGSPNSQANQMQNGALSNPQNLMIQSQLNLLNNFQANQNNFFQDGHPSIAQQRDYNPLIDQVAQLKNVQLLNQSKQLPLYYKKLRLIKAHISPFKHNLYCLVKKDRSYKLAITPPNQQILKKVFMENQDQMRKNLDACLSNRNKLNYHNLLNRTVDRIKNRSLTYKSALDQFNEAYFSLKQNKKTISIEEIMYNQALYLTRVHPMQQANQVQSLLNISYYQSRLSAQGEKLSISDITQNAVILSINIQLFTNEQQQAIIVAAGLDSGYSYLQIQIDLNNVQKGQVISIHSLLNIIDLSVDDQLVVQLLLGFQYNIKRQWGYSEEPIFFYGYFFCAQHQYGRIQIPLLYLVKYDGRLTEDEIYIN